MYVKMFVGELLLSETRVGYPALLFVLGEQYMVNKQKSKNIPEIIYQIANPIANTLGLEIWDIKLVKEGPNQYLRVFIDSEDGITLNDCENMSRALDLPLDELDPISDSYFLEVCSPGIERELSKDEHLETYIGYSIKIRLIRPDKKKRKEVFGVLKSFNKYNIEIEEQLEAGKTSLIDRKNISHINLDEN